MNTTMRYQLLIGMLLFSLARVAPGQIIPPDRCIPWSRDIVGIPGGIPPRPDVTITLHSGVTDKEINQAIAECPEGGVVFLEAGTYPINQPIVLGFHPGVTIRGAGMGKTILLGAVKNSGAIVASGQSGVQTPRQIVNGVSKGATSLELSSATDAQLGGLVSMSRINDPDLVWSRWGIERVMRERALITAIDGNRISIWPPMAFDFPDQLSPTCELQQYLGLRRSGLEDITIVASSANGTPFNVWFDSTYACWLKNVESVNADNTHFFFSKTVRNEVKGCYVHETSSTTDGYGIEVYGEDTGILVEDNVFAHCFMSVIVNQTVGSVFAYNYSVDCQVKSFPHQVPAFICNHGPHGMMNLWEGNVGEQFQSDGYHGSSSHQTLFRNRFHGLNSYNNDNRKMVDLCRYSYWFNVVGNVLGESWAKGDGIAYELQGSPPYSLTQCIYRLGYPDMGDNSYSNVNPPSDPDNGGLDPKVKTTLLRHGNYDFQSGSTNWDPSIAEHTLPNSLYLTGKPDWFGDVVWPPIGPDQQPIVNRIPAEIRYEQLKKIPRTPTNLRLLQ